MRASLLGLVFVVGCGIGHSQANDADGGGGGGGDDAGGGSDSGLVSACGTSVPTTGAVCSKEGLVCEFGSDPSSRCNTFAGCVNGAWQIQRKGGSDCPTPTGSKSCPATYAGVKEGAVCPQDGLECGYPGVGYCVCTTPFEGPPNDDAPEGPYWYCDSPAYGCPTPRPRVGAPCKQESQYCDYGACMLPGGVALKCEGGVWTGGEMLCPL